MVVRIRNFYLLFVVALVGCGSIKKEFRSAGGSDAAIQNAILDFSKTEKLYKKSSVFHVTYYDTVYRMLLLKDSAAYRWVPDLPYDDILAVEIFQNFFQFLLTSKDTIGSLGRLPSRFFEQRGKLFYWYENNIPLTKESLELLEKYNLVRKLALGEFPDYTFTGHGSKAAQYYFCRNDLSRFKKVVTSVPLEYNEPPKLKCIGDRTLSNDKL